MKAAQALGAAGRVQRTPGELGVRDGVQAKREARKQKNEERKA